MKNLDEQITSLLFKRKNAEYYILISLRYFYWKKWIEHNKPIQYYERMYHFINNILKKYWE
jgi:hypothetical protein